MSVKLAMEEARRKLDQDWATKYPNGQMELYWLYENHHEKRGQKWYADIFLSRTTAGGCRKNQYDTEGCRDGSRFNNRHRLYPQSKHRKGRMVFSNREEWIAACLEKNIIIKE